ncbi:succinate dehydrogenase assembly factor 2 [Qingshengfaniella alkalisoli]|uniref:FAD assembly factor SdhE n=1 Tax=Qingshengfaniella alkalisoli TaxID=2599296 RepID=A0A5B8J653_9RHOB|nr:succinate dehydrogenase assembly factor 2 [Qingshengfaniella alkalisoli]QDY69820.1 succinate dehydrogenase assembly factor 2 [Qingshengfaniella alkalisoli]
MTSESNETRLKRLQMRSMRRGIKEMDIILGEFARTHLDKLDEQQIALYEGLLEENDHDLYQWVSGASPTPAEYLNLLTYIAATRQTSDV